MKRLLLLALCVPVLAGADRPDWQVFVDGYLGVHIPGQWDLQEAGDLSSAVDSGAVLGVRAGGYPLWWLGAQGHLAILPRSGDAGDDVTLDYGLAALFHAWQWDWNPFLTTGLGFYANVSGDSGDDVDYNFFWGAGVVGPLTGRLELTAQLRHLITDGHDSANVANNLEVVLGLRFVALDPSRDGDGDGVDDHVDACPKRKGPASLKGCPDRDGDGVPDDDDACERIPGDASGQGCPDGDGDGLIDSEDRCRTVPGLIDLHGCPDRDRDGVPDDLDKCIDVPEDRDNWQDVDGCPDPDNDGDDYEDHEDKCPNDAEDVDGFQDEDGCPDLDDDGDGVLDADDSCPRKPETANGFQDADGCPDSLTEITATHVVVKQKFRFVPHSPEIDVRNRPLLDAVAKALMDNPDITLVRVGVHTDDRGTIKSNRKLSRARARKIVAYLVQKGVNQTRLAAWGYGESKPLEEDVTDQARARNRRVEFQILERR